ncbi:MAG: UvrD-helicase domain-containing protein [Anaerolineales bacterium]|nr:UvrD-helicase domain-containing protein [Anaerolineales bacterium]
MEYLQDLNPQQQQAVTAGLGPILVLAGPGSGKTRVLTQRIAYLIGSLGVRPYQILAVTFTNKAAREMEHRVMDLLGGETQGLSLGTFHANCARILRREAEAMPFNANFVIYDTDDQLSLVKNAIKDLNLDEKYFRPAGVHAAISNAKNELLLPDDYPITNYRDETVATVYRRYQESLLANNALDFDDLLLWTAFLLEESPAAREKYARRYEHVLVDEFQDTNMAQYILLKHLASFHHNIFVVGDVDQSIYRWRGADYRNVLRFERDFPDTQTILLEQNYRSTQSILDVAMAVIDRNPQRARKQLFTERGMGEKVRLIETEDDQEEAALVVEKIASQVLKKTAQPGDFAVMYRTNAQSRLLEEAFLKSGIPHKLVGAQRFYGRREVKDVVAYLRLVHNPQDEISLTRVINTPARGIGNKTVITLRTLAQQTKQSPGMLLLALGQDPDSIPGSQSLGRGFQSLCKFGTLLAGWKAQINALSPMGLMDRILTDTDYHEYLDDGSEEGQERWENVIELRRLAADFAEKGLTAFLEQVALVSDQDTLDASGNAATLLTLHAAKGLEFPVVFIVGLAQGTLPHSRSLEDPEEMQEERRLLYVGITRAKDRLILVYSRRRNLFGYYEPVEPSEFLDDIPDELLTRTGASMVIPRQRSVGLFSAQRWQPSSADEALPMVQRFQPGQRVEHGIWGEGMVLNSRLQDDDEVVDIFFESVGLKRVAASLAKLTII